MAAQRYASELRSAAACNPSPVLRHAFALEAGWARPGSGGAETRLGSDWLFRTAQAWREFWQSGCRERLRMAARRSLRYPGSPG